MSLEYVLITPARNEASYIERTIRAVISQTRLPKRWIIVSDGSTDGTDEIVESYQRDRPWLELVKLPPRTERDFAGKVNAVKVGLQRVQDLGYDIFGNLDGDVSFGPDYIEFLLGKFETMPDLGVAGTHYTEDGFHSYDDSFMNESHVNGAVQMFRRECWGDIGGYVPIRGGGVDWVAVTTARMMGWVTRSFSERVFEHHRPIGTAGGNVLKARFHYGRKDYFLGGHPLWELFRATFQMTKSPYVVGGLALLCGYVWCWLTAPQRPVSEQLMRFHRREQMARLRGLLRRRLHLGRSVATQAPRP